MSAPRGRPRGGGTPPVGARLTPNPASAHSSPGPSYSYLPSTYTSLLSNLGNAKISPEQLLATQQKVIEMVNRGSTYSGATTSSFSASTSYTGSFPSSSTSYPSTSTNYSSYTHASSYPSAVSSQTGLIGLSGASIVPAGAPPPSARPSGVPGNVDEDGEGDDEMLPAMADDDYSAQLSWQSQSKDNLKVLMDNFTPLQYDRFEAYRRHALPKQAVRKVIQQTLGLQVSPPVAQIVAGFAKVFVGEIIEKARAVQERRGETGPLTPDHLREAYRMYQQETGSVGAARPVRGKKLFVR